MVDEKKMGQKERVVIFGSFFELDMGRVLSFTEHYIPLPLYKPSCWRADQRQTCRAAGVPAKFGLVDPVYHTPPALGLQMQSKQG